MMTMQPRTADNTQTGKINEMSYEQMSGKITIFLFSLFSSTVSLRMNVNSYILNIFFLLRLLRHALGTRLLTQDKLLHALDWQNLSGTKDIGQV